MLGEPITDRRTARHEATKTEILGVAWELVRESGLASLSLRDLAKRVGMQAPSLYSYFPSKNAIYDAMYAQGAQAFVDAQAAVELTGDPLADMKAISRFFVGFCTADVARYQLLFQRTIPGFEPTPESFAISVASLRAIHEHFESIVGMSQEDLDLWTALGTGITDQQISNDPGGDRWLKLVDEAQEMFFNHLQSKAKKGRSRK